jgi:hypothetical protein
MAIGNKRESTGDFVCQTATIGQFSYVFIESDDQSEDMQWEIVLKILSQHSFKSQALETVLR